METNSVQAFWFFSALFAISALATFVLYFFYSPRFALKLLIPTVFWGFLALLAHRYSATTTKPSSTGNTISYQEFVDHYRPMFSTLGKAKKDVKEIEQEIYFALHSTIPETGYRISEILGDGLTQCLAFGNCLALSAYRGVAVPIGSEKLLLPRGHYDLDQGTVKRDEENSDVLSLKWTNKNNRTFQLEISWNPNKSSTTLVVPANLLPHLERPTNVRLTLSELNPNRKQTVLKRELKLTWLDCSGQTVNRLKKATLKTSVFLQSGYEGNASNTLVAQANPQKQKVAIAYVEQNTWRSPYETVLIERANANLSFNISREVCDPESQFKPNPTGYFSRNFADKTTRLFVEGEIGWGVSLFSPIELWARGTMAQEASDPPLASFKGKPWVNQNRLHLFPSCNSNIALTFANNYKVTAKDLETALGKCPFN